MKPAAAILRAFPAEDHSERPWALPADKTSPAAVAAMLAKAAKAKDTKRAFCPAIVPAPSQRLPAAEKPDAGEPLRIAKRPGMTTQAQPQEASSLASLAPGSPGLVTKTLRRLSEALQPKPAPNPQDLEETAIANLDRALASEAGSGKRVLAVAAAFAFGWAGLVPLSGAVIVAGSLVLQSSVKKVQHPAGGVVSGIFVHNGSKVKAGGELVQLEETASRANLQVVARQLDEMRLRLARLNAERDGLAEPRWPKDMTAELSAAERNQLFVSERDLFLARASGRRDQQNLALSRIEQYEKQIAGLEAQLAANSRQIAITAGEVKNVERLLAEKLVTIERLTGLQRESARLDGLDGQLRSQIAETHNKIAETRIQAMQAEESFRSEVMRDLREAESKEGELIERKLAAEDQLKRTVIRAPVGGTIQELAIHTAGGVVTPGEVMMTVVPEGDELEIDAHLSPDKIDQVHAGQPAHIRFPAFNARTTPGVEGVVTVVSEDVVHDPQGGGYYDLRIALPPEEVRRLGGLRLVAGMPAEVFLETGRRTMLSYLFKPLSDQLTRMFRER
jgi:HlyD family secretion protein